MKSLRIKILGLTLLCGSLALCGIGLWLLLSPAQYRATVIIKAITEDVSDSVAFEANLDRVDVGYDGYYNSYLIQCTFDTLKSDLILTNVVTSLNLNEIGRNNTFSDKNMRMAEATEEIRKRISLTPVPRKRLLAISFCWDDSQKAALIANAIAQAYVDYRINAPKELRKKGLEILRQQYLDEEKQLSLQPTNNDQLLKAHKLLGERIDAEKLEADSWSIMRLKMFQIFDRAKPPQSPIGANGPLGAAIFAIGLFALLAGILLLKPSRKPAV